MISVIIPVFNRQNVFERSLRSALAQTYRDVEIIIVDDGSSVPIILPPGTSEIVHLFRQENKGAPAARNLGFTKSKGEYVIFWDADVIAEPALLEKMLAAFEKNPTASYAYCDFYFGHKKMPAQTFDANRLKETNYITMTSLLHRADFPGFDEQLKKFQDWDLWLTLLEKGKVGVHVPEYLFKAETGGTMSTWLPHFAYTSPWKFLPFFKTKVVAYENAKTTLRQKHPGLFN